MRTKATRIAVGLTGAAAAILTGVAAPAAATAVPAASASSWTADGHDASRSFANPAERAVTAATVGHLKKLYTITPKRGDDACPDVLPPLVAGGRIYTPDPSGDTGGLAAYDAASGKRQWRATFDDFVVSPRDLRLAYSDGRIFVTDDGCDSYSSPSGDVAAYDAATGKLLWHVFTPSRGAEELVVARGLVVTSGDGASDEVAGTSAYAPATGKRVWKRDGAYLSAGVLASGLLVLNDQNGDRTVAVDVATGRTRWILDRKVEAVAGFPGTGTFLAREQVGGGSRLVSLSVLDGATKWTAPGGDAAVDGATVYVTQADRTVVARHVADGGVAWTRSIGGSAASQNPVVAGGLVYVTRPGAGGTSAVLALRAGDGTTVGTVATVGVTDHPVVAGGHVYLTVDESLQAYGLS